MGDKTDQSAAPAGPQLAPPQDAEQQQQEQQREEQEQQPAPAAAGPPATAQFPQPRRQRNIRRKRALDELEAEPEEEGAAIPGAGADAEGGDGGAPAALSAEDIRLLQKARQRRAGTDASVLAVSDDKGRRGGGEADGGPAAAQDVLEAAFKRERLRVTEEDDPHMKEYIEQQLAQRLGKRVEQGGEGRSRPAPDDLDALLPETIKPRQVDMELGPSWVAGISEVPLSIEQKLQNIEETEAAKKRILQKSMAAMMGIVPQEDEVGRSGPRRQAFPARFGRLGSEEEKRIEEARKQKAEQREFHYKKRLEKKDRNARAPAWL